MIRVMVVDDESPALKQAAQVLKTFTDVQICGLFTDIDRFMEQLSAERVDLVLLDMEMPDIHGLQLARSIQAFNPDISIAFVTAHDEYAVSAFDTDAMDYLLKPLEEERLEKTLQRFRQRRQRIIDNASDNVGAKGASIRCFGRFTLMTNDGDRVKFRNSKSEELLAYLIHYHGEQVDKAQIMEALWYGQDFIRTQANLYTTAYQLRKDLEAYGLYDVIEQSKGGGGSYRLRLSPDISDVYAYEKALQIIRSGGFDIIRAEQAAELYRSGYLKEHDYGWAEQRQTELEFSYSELLEGITNHYLQQKSYRRALQVVHKWANRYPYNESIHGKMIALLLLMNNAKEARSYYDKVSEEIFKNELGIALDLDYTTIVSNPYAMFELTPDS
ncbi:response regulator [Cohnella cellulosilytica]|uniref:Response regulator n=1 Tax=Cohnella cellulosilytica TaxID=986710 RepID=A0ABW2FLX6_9BACL